MCTDLNLHAAPEHDNAVGIFDCGESMGNNDNCNLMLLSVSVDGILNRLFIHLVKR